MAMTSPELRDIAQDRFFYMAEKMQQGGNDSEAFIDDYQRQIFALARDESRRSVASMPWLPQLPEVWAYQEFERIEEKEGELIAGDYDNGTATFNHEIREVKTDHEGSFVFTAEHATRPVRRNAGFKKAVADVGTAGLAAVLGEDYGRALIAVGRQTRPFKDDPDHAMNERLKPLVPSLEGFISIHGIAGGKFTTFHDRTEVQAIVGLGPNPSEYQYEHAKKLVQKGKDIGLKVIIGNDTPFHVQLDRSHEAKLDDRDRLYQHMFYAHRPNSTTAFVQDELTKLETERPAYQLELTRFLRYVPIEDDERDPVSRVIGVALGARLIRAAVEVSRAEVD